MAGFCGLGMHLGNLSRLSAAKTRSITAENPTGEKGCGAMAEIGVGSYASRDLGKGWKVNPYTQVLAGELVILADVQGSGAVQHIWMTLTGKWRNMILRFYWDGSKTPAVECPAGDFFACGWNEFSQINSLPMCVNPGSGFNCYWEMPFRRGFRITAENRGDEDMVLFYQIDYTLTDVPDDAAYFHAQFRRVNPLPYKDVYSILDVAQGKGHFVGTYMAWGVNNNGWWGEGEIKFYIDGDGEFPTICSTGTEDYFCGSYGFENPRTKQYQDYTTPYAGMPQILRPDGIYRSQTRFGLYRWHIMDPVRFETDLKVTIQALGWRSGGRYLPLQDDISSVAYWYQTLPTVPFQKLPDNDYLEII